MAFVALFESSTDRSLVPITGKLSMAADYPSAMDSPAFDASDSLRVRPFRTHRRYNDSNRALLINAELEFEFEGMITNPAGYSGKEPRCIQSWALPAPST